MYNQAVGQAEEQRIADWADLWFGPNKRSGYIAVTDFHRQRFYGAKDLKLLRRDTEGVHQRFISLNAFAFGSRQTVNLKQIRNIGIDLDQYKFGLSIEEGLDELNVLILDKVIPEPNLVLTSRGIQIFYSIENGAAPAMAYLVSYITDQFIAKMKHIGADSNAKDLSRVMRVPNSVNERNNAPVAADVWYPTPYTLQDLQAYCKPLEAFGTRQKKKAKVTRLLPKVHDDKLSFFYRTNYVRLMDLEKLIEVRNGDLSGKRNSFLYVYAYHQSLICNSFTDLEVFLSDVFARIHSRTDRAMSKREFHRTIRSAYKDAQEFFEYFKGNGYRVTYVQNDGIKKPYRTDNLIELLEITEEEQRKLKRLVGAKVAKEHDASRKREQRRAAGVKPKDEYQASRKQTQKERVESLRQLINQNPNLTHAELAEELCVSTKTIQRLTKLL